MSKLEPNHLAGLDGLRGIAALMVFVYHSPWVFWGASMHEKLGSSETFILSLDAGVGLFFALSAYLLSAPLWRAMKEGRSPSLERFMVRRACRILPAYWLAVAVTLFFDGRTWSSWGLVNLILHSLALQTHLAVNFLWSINNVLWTISVEFQFYIILALLFSWGFRSNLLRKGNGLGLLGIITAIFLLSDPIYAVCVHQFAPHLPEPVWGGAITPQAVVSWNVFYFLKWFLPGIVFGWLSVNTAWLMPGSEKSAHHWIFADGGLLLLSGVLCYVLTQAGEANWRTSALYGWPLNALLFSSIVALTPISRLGPLLLDNRFLCWIGAVSYGIYLWHYPILKSIASGSLSERFSGWPLLLIGAGIGLIVVIGVASVSYAFFEHPINRACRRTKTFRELGQQLLAWLKAD